MAISLGAGDDTLTIRAATDLASASATVAGDILDGGDGTDTFSVTTATGNGQTAGYTGMSNFEVLSFSDALGASTTVTSYQAGLTTVTLTAGADNSDAAALVMEAGANTVNLGGQLLVILQSQTLELPLMTV